jgi:cytosine/adenosine deaminase-related metal-dependent hydrolase
LRTRVDTHQLIAYQDGEHTVIDRGVLVYEGNTIVHAGPDYDGPSDAVIDATDRIVAPGFVSTHTHMGGSPFDRSFREDVKDYWATGLYETLMPIRDAATEASTEAAARASCLELIRSGVTTAIDLSAWPEATVKGAEESGLRAYIGQYVRSSVWGTDGVGISFVPIGDEEEQRLLDSSVAFIRRYADDPDSRIKGLFAPAQIDTCSPELLRKVHSLAEELDVPIEIHAAQSVAEFNEIMSRSGMTPVEYLRDVGILDSRLIVGHCLIVSGHSWLHYPHSDDLKILADSGATVAHCPTVFARHGQAMETFAEYRKRGVNVGLGVDTTPQSMLMEMRLAAALSRVISRSEIAGTARQVFDAATLVGASALGREDLGRLAVGAKADFVTYRTDTVTMAPLRDPLRNIVHHAGPADVDTVVIDGRVVLEDGQPVYADEREIAQQLQAAAEQVWRDFPQHHHAGRTAEEVSPLSLPHAGE